MKTEDADKAKIERKSVAVIAINMEINRLMFFLIFIFLDSVADEAMVFAGCGLAAVLSQAHILFHG